jgi:transposase
MVLPEAIQQAVLREIANGKSTKSISDTFSIHRNTVLSYRKLAKSSETVRLKRRVSLKRKFSDKERLKIRNFLDANPALTMAEAAAAVAEKLHKTISIKHMRRIMRSFGIHKRSAARKPFVNDLQRRKRQDFAKRMLALPPAVFQRVVFSDEAMIELWPTRTIKVFRRVGERYLAKNCVPTVKHSPKLMVWGCFSPEGVISTSFRRRCAAVRISRGLPTRY